MNIPTGASSTDGKGFMGVEHAGRIDADGLYSFPDPYLRRFRAANPSCLVPGQDLPGSIELENRADNISNYSLQDNQ
ncbi:hypothetical protein [Rhodopirellula sallentina]|uniref:Uncharacterized protein n=1 Tax=Rhodopirellula sallentina SM41 TaxID=1263870 RepID=M5U239_9BACT|nr:hypothetical protein [Rhodopirellula sallentina]EMI55527.1 hypothetical protein RSSM_03029 [Rhodopirellula sallentina SM41]